MVCCVIRSRTRGGELSTCRYEGLLFVSEATSGCDPGVTSLAEVGHHPLLLSDRISGAHCSSQTAPVVHSSVLDPRVRASLPLALTSPARPWTQTGVQPAFGQGPPGPPLLLIQVTDRAAAAPGRALGTTLSPRLSEFFTNLSFFSEITLFLLQHWQSKAGRMPLLLAASARAAGAPANSGPCRKSRFLMTWWVFDSKFIRINIYSIMSHDSALGSQEDGEKSV